MAAPIESTPLSNIIEKVTTCFIFELRKLSESLANKPANLKRSEVLNFYHQYAHVLRKLLIILRWSRGSFILKLCDVCVLFFFI